MPLGGEPPVSPDPVIPLVSLEKILRPDGSGPRLWIVTAAAGTRRGGLVATWLHVTSPDPRSPVVLLSLTFGQHTAELIDASRTFVAHPLAAGDWRLAWNFARDSGRARDKLSGIACGTGPGGAPILDEAAAWASCRVVQRAEADRIYYWAEVTGGEVRRADEPPLNAGDLSRCATSEQLRQLAAARAADQERYRERLRVWRGN